MNKVLRRPRIMRPIHAPTIRRRLRGIPNDRRQPLVAQRPDLVVRFAKLTDGETEYHVEERMEISGRPWVKLRNPDPRIGDTEGTWFELTDAPGSIGELRLAGKWRRR